jgi:twitching motility protein PilT
MLNMENLLSAMLKKGASDLHLTADAPPTLRVDGLILNLPLEKLTSETAQSLIYSILTETQRKTFESRNELDLALQIKDIGRVRANIFRQKGTVAAAFRIIQDKFQTFDELGLAPVTTDLIKLPKGLVLVTGQTGAGKSTTIASMINYINETRACHIITVEDPIEFVHTHKKSLVEQREVGSDTHDFGDALKYILRQDPDVILIGEMRDLETIQAALNLAETGHLVFATLHTNDCPSSINRIIDVFSPHQQEQVRAQLSFVLQAIICQTLIPMASGRGRALACEALVATAAVRNLIREGKIEQIYLNMQTGAKQGMQTMNKALLQLVNKRLISRPDALGRSTNPEELEKLLSNPQGTT